VSIVVLTMVLCMRRYSNGSLSFGFGFSYVIFPLIYFSVDDVYAFSEKLEKAGCLFQKKPDEGT
jgi:hypothetical protein